MPNFKKYYPEDVFREKRNEQKKKNYAQTAKYKKRLWTEEEDNAVLAQDVTDRELSSDIRRSVQSIQIRRSRLKNGMKEEIED